MLRIDRWDRVMVFALKMTRCRMIDAPGVSCASMKVQAHSGLVVVKLECVSYVKVCDAFNTFHIGTPVNSAESKVGWVVWFSMAS
jgi:hypothetical protein